MKPIKAKFFWLRSPLRTYVRALNCFNTTKGQTNDLPWKEGYLVGVVPAGKALTESDLLQLSTYHTKNSEVIKKIIMRVSTQTRYLTIFPESENIHVFYQEHVGEIFELS